MGAGAAIVIILIVFALVVLYLRHRAKKQALEKIYGHVPSHVELYFEEYFEDMIDSWDLIKRDEAKEWSQGMEGRLNSISMEIDRLKNKSSKIDDQFDKVESRIGDLEEEWNEEVKL